MPTLCCCPIGVGSWVPRLDPGWLRPVEWIVRPSNEPLASVAICRPSARTWFCRRWNYGPRREKFAAAERMFFTPLGLEQATDEVVAACKAERFPAGGPLADLCCGVGGDLLALAARGPVCGVDRDPIMATIAEANARVTLGCDNRVSVQTNDVRSLDIAPFTAWHIDPDRRSSGRRTTRVELHEPPPEVIERLLAVCPNGAVKLAPAAALPTGWSERAELEWFSSRRECRQLVAWFGNLASRPSQRQATMLGAAPERAPHGLRRAR